MYNNKASPSLSIERLSLDLTQDPLRLLNVLLRQCWLEFSRVDDLSDGDLNGKNNVSDINSIYLTLTDRLNALVALSPKVFFRFRNASNLRQPILIAVYRVLSLAIWCCQRAIRCAGLRCLRYYVRTSEDVDLFLANRLDLFITRCLDLSYMEELLAPLTVVNDDSSCDNEWGAKSQGMPPYESPYRKLPANSKRIARNIGFQRPFHKPVPLTAATDTAERRAVVRLAFHLLRLSVRSFSSDLVHGLAAAAASASMSAPTSPPAEFNFVRDVGEEGPLPISPLCSKFGTGRERDNYLRSYLLLLTEFVMRSCGLHEESRSTESRRSVVTDSRRSPLAVAVKSLLSALPCCGEPGDVYKHSPQVMEILLLALLRLSAESRNGRQIVDSWLFQKCLSPFLITFPAVTVPRSPYDSNPSFLAATRTSLVFVLRSWSGLFYFLHEGQSCLHTLMQSLLLGSSKLRSLVLNVLYNLFPGVPALTPTTTLIDGTANSVIGDLSSAFYTGLPYPPASYRQREKQHNRQSVAECLSLFPYIDGDFVVEEGLRIFSFVRPAGTDILEVHSALLLCCLAQAGLFEALIAAVNDVSSYVAAAAGQLLGILSFRANSQLHPDSPCLERLANIRLLRDKFRAVDFLDRVHQIMVERHQAGARPILVAPLISPFLESLSRQQSDPPGPSNSGKGPDAGLASIMRKPSANLARSASAYQYMDGLLEAVIKASGVCAPAPALIGCSLAASSMSRKGAAPSFHTSLPHGVTAGVASTSILSSSLSSPYDWDWGILVSWARKLSSFTGLFSWKDQCSQNFLTRLIDFITPNLEVLSLPLEVAYPSGTSPLYPLLRTATGGQEDVFPLSPAYLRLLSRSVSGGPVFSSNSKVIPSLAWTSRNWPHAWAAATLLAGLLPHLSLYQPDSLPGTQLRRFLVSVHTCLLAATAASVSPVNLCTHLLFQHIHLREHCSSLLLFGLGRLLACDTGSSLLCSMDIPDLLLALTVGGSNIDRNRQVSKSSDPQAALLRQRLLCAKFLLSSVNYVGSGFGRSLLSTICSSGHIALRLFTTKFIHLLLRINLPLSEAWLLPLLLSLCYDRSAKVADEAVSVLEEACLNPIYLQSLVDYIQTEDRRNTKRCCTASFPSPLLRLLSIGSLASQRVVACLLAKSTWMFKMVSTPKLMTPRPLLTVQPCEGIDVTLLERILRAWMKVYNEQYAISFESRLLNSFRLPLLQNDCSSATKTHPKFLQCCPACNRPLTSDYETGKTDTKSTVKDEVEAEEEALAAEMHYFVNRQNSHLPLNRFDEDAGLAETGAKGKESEEVAIELSPVAVQFFYHNSSSFSVPLHLFYCLALQDAGFQVLRDNEYLSTLADTLAQSCHQGTDKSATHTKSAIWALANVLVTPNGSRWARASAVLKDIFWLIANAESLSVRGNAWLGVCFVASSVCGSSLLRPWILGSRDGREAKMEPAAAWLLSTTDRGAHLWPLRERRVLYLNAQVTEGALDARSTSPISSLASTPPSTNKMFSHLGKHFKPPMAFSTSAPMQQQNTHPNMLSVGCLFNATDATFMDAATVNNSFSPAHSPASSLSAAESKTSRRMDQLLRPVRWIARRAAYSLRGQYGAAGRGPIFEPPANRDLGELGPAMAVEESRNRAISVASATSGHVGGGVSCNIVQSLSSPDWFCSAHAFDSATDSKSASASLVNTPATMATNSHQFSLTDVFVFRGLFLPYDVSVLGRNFFPRSPAPLCSDAMKPEPINVKSFDGKINEKLVESSTDCIQKLCFSAACRSAHSSCPDSAAGDNEVESWRHEVVEEVENLMNSLLFGRVYSSLLVLCHRALTGAFCGRRHRYFSSACLHAEVAEILVNYRYSRPARTLVQTFLGRFPPSKELLADAKAALEDWNNLTPWDLSSD